MEHEHNEQLEHEHGHEYLHANGIAHLHYPGDDHTPEQALSHEHPHEASGHGHTHANTRAVVNRLARAIGHLEHVKKMVEEGRDCSEVLVQIAAVRAAIAGRRFDVVVEWIAFKPERVRRDVEIFNGVCDQYILISSCAAYERPLRSPVITARIVSIGTAPAMSKFSSRFSIQP